MVDSAANSDSAGAAGVVARKTGPVFGRERPSKAGVGLGSGPDGDVPIHSGMRGRNRFPKQRRAAVYEWGAILAIALAVAFLVRTFVVQAFWIPSESMEPTLRIGDHLLVEKVTPSVRDIHRREIIVFERPEGVDPELKDLIKRVIGLPGELVEGKEGRVFINGKAIVEPYLPKGVVPTEFDFAPVRVPIDSYFVMGDNRGRSFDSRYWGAVRRDQIVGRAVFRIWPLGDSGSL